MKRVKYVVLDCRGKELISSYDENLIYAYKVGIEKGLLLAYDKVKEVYDISEQRSLFDSLLNDEWKLTIEERIEEDE